MKNMRAILAIVFAMFVSLNMLAQDKSNPKQVDPNSQVKQLETKKLPGVQAKLAKAEDTPEFYDLMLKSNQARLAQLDASSKQAEVLKTRIETIQKMKKRATGNTIGKKCISLSKQDLLKKKAEKTNRRNQRKFAK